MFFHTREFIVAGAFLTAFAVTVDKTSTETRRAGALVEIQRHTRSTAFGEAHVKLHDIHFITFICAFWPTTSAPSGTLSSTTLPAPTVTL